MKKTVTIYGAGYVGLVTGACLAELGHSVLLIDTQAEKIASLQQGICPIHEPGLDTLLQRHIASGRLTFSTDLAKGVQHGLLQFIAVGTPSLPDGSADLRYVFEVATSIAQQLKDYRLIITKSTVPVGTAYQVKQRIEEILKQRNVAVDFDVAANPEFLKQGAAIEDFMRPDRIIFGVDSERALKHLQELYAALNDNSLRFLAMNVVSAELTKYAANAHLAMRISFMNEMSQLAERVGANIDMIRRGIGSDQRIGSHFLFAGCGFGGSCFPKDVRALQKMAEAVDYDMPLIRAIDTVNQQQKQVLFQKISRHFANDLAGKTIALWGLAFKPNTDDMREATSSVLIEQLLQSGANIRAYDPVAEQQAKRIHGEHPALQYCDKALQALDGADVLVIVTEWEEFRHPDFSVIKSKLKQPVIFDGRNLYDPAVVNEAGLKYYAIGHGDRLC